MTAQLKFDQVGLSAGVAGKSREDGLSTGAVVTVVNASGLACTAKFLWVPPADTSVVLTQTNATTWTFTPQAGVFGTYQVELTETSTSTTDVKDFMIPTPVAGLIIPASGAYAPVSANLSSTTGEKNAAAALASVNSGPVSWAGWQHFWAALVMAVESQAASPASSSRREIIWRPGFVGSSSTVFASFANALAAALSSTGEAVIILDPSVSSTFTLPNSNQSGAGRVSIDSTKVLGATCTVVFDTDSMLSGFTGITAHIGVAVVLSAAAAGAQGAHFRHVDHTTKFKVKGNVSRTGAGARRIWLDDSSTAATAVVRTLEIEEFRHAGAAGVFASANALRVVLYGTYPFAATANLIASTGSSALIVEVGNGVQFDPTLWAAWSPTPTIVLGAGLRGVDTAGVVSGDWPETAPTTALEAVNKLAKRGSKIESFVNPLVFDRPKAMYVDGGAGTLALTLAGSGHANLPECTIFIWIKKSATYSLVTCDAAFLQKGNPFADFDPAYGYHIYLTRSSDGTSTTFSVTAKVVDS